MKNLLIRTVSGLTLVAILVGGILFSPLTSFIVLGIIALGSLRELGKLFTEAGIHTMRLFTFVTAALLLAMQLINIVCVDYYITLKFTLIIMALLFIIRCTIELYRKKENPFESIAHEIFAIVYTVMPIVILNSIADYRFVLILFVIVWTNDVAAYLFGSMLGKHKLFERISPKKSWEGFAGGLLMGCAAAVVSAWLIGGDLFTWGAIGLITSLAGVGGDLFESMFKRSIAIKDSGHTIPGHGGFLDRFDALFFAAPIYYILLLLTGISV